MNSLNKIISKGLLFIKVFRRIVDYSLFYLVLSTLALFLPGFVHSIPVIILIAILIVLFACIEAVFISTWGKTPGMALCGLAVRNVEGKKLSFKEAFEWVFFLRRGKQVILHQRWGIILGFLASLACILGVISTQDFKNSWKTYGPHQTVSGWVHHLSKEAGFSADFPSRPVKESKVMEITSVRRTLNYDEFVSRTSPYISYSVGAIELPKKWSVFSSSTLLKGALTVLTESSFEAQLMGKAFTSHMRYPALDYRIKQGEQEIHGRLILIGSTLYKLAVTFNPSQLGPDADLHKSEFFDSFAPQAADSKMVSIIRNDLDKNGPG